MYIGSPPNVVVCSLYRGTQINPHHRPTAPRHHIGETPHPAAGIQHRPSDDILEPKSDFRLEPCRRVVLSQTIELRTTEQIPLRTEVRSVTVTCKSGYIVVDRVRAALAAQVPCPYLSVVPFHHWCLDLQRAQAHKTLQNLKQIGLQIGRAS